MKVQVSWASSYFVHWIKVFAIVNFAGNQPTLGDQGLVVLTNLLPLHGIAADPAQIQHDFGGAPIDVSEMLRFAKRAGLKARVFNTSFGRLEKTPLPGIAPLKD